MIVVAQKGELKDEIKVEEAKSKLKLEKDLTLRAIEVSRRLNMEAMKRQAESRRLNMKAM